MSTVAATVDQVTARWANALYNLARDSGALTQVRADMQRLGVELESADVRSYILGSSVASTTRLAKLDSLLAGFHQLSANFVRLLFERRREEVLGQVAVAFRQRSLEEDGAVEGVVESARPLDAPDVQSLCASLGARLGKEVLLSTRIDASLVGGVRVFVGSSMIDQSVQGRLEALSERLMGATLPTLT